MSVSQTFENECIYILSSFVSVEVSAILLSSVNPLDESGLILWKAVIISFFVYEERVSGQVTERMILVSECSIIQIGKKFV